MTAVKREHQSGRVFIIAEVGVNHNGDPALASRLIDVAADAGADAVKFQTFRADMLSTDSAPVAIFLRGAVGALKSQQEMLRALELKPESYSTLKAYADSRGIEFISTPFDRGSLAYLVDEIGVKTIKIGSGDITDGPLLLDAARSGCKLIVSTGMCDLEEVGNALDLIAFGMTTDGIPTGADDFSGCRMDPGAAVLVSERLTLLHCTSLYPAPVHSVNLRAMLAMREAFGVDVGYSDHTLGGTVALAAAAAGATVIEKHVTLDKAMLGPDHSASMEPNRFAELVRDIRQIECALGSDIKSPLAAEEEMRRVARKSLVAARPIAVGSILTAGDLAAKRPADGVSPMEFWDFVNTEAPRDYEPDQGISN